MAASVQIKESNSLQALSNEKWMAIASLVLVGIKINHFDL